MDSTTTATNHYLMSATAHRIEEQSLVLRTDSEQGITTLTLNRPKQFNALSEEMLAAVLSQIEMLKTDESVRVVVLAANGAAFCAGHDLKQMRSNHDESYYHNLFKQCTAMMLGLLSLPQPVIARVHGMATAAGCQLVANCDLAIASTDAKFAVSGINLGLFCSTPGVALSRNVPRKRAFEMLITGKFIDAHQAAEWDLINQAVAPDQLDTIIDKFTQSILEKPQVAVTTGKKMFYEQIVKELPQAYAYAGDVMACNMMADDTVEGVDAFIEKRSPNWKK